MHPLRLVFLLLFAGCAAQRPYDPSAYKPEFVPSERIVSNWNRFSQTEVIGRIAKFERWEKFADRTFCGRAPALCDALAANLRVGIAEIAQSETDLIAWPVVIPIAHKLREGDFVRFRIPAQQALAEPTLKHRNHILESIKTCSWSPPNNASKVSGVICEDWSYASLDYLW